MHTIDDVRRLSLARIADDRGFIIPLDDQSSLPFAVTRVFTVHPAGPGEARGGHAHRQCQQIFVCLAGSCAITCRDGDGRREFVLDDPAQGLFVPASLWSEQTYESTGTVLLVANDRPYEEDDYIRDFEDFLHFRGAGE